LRLALAAADQGAWSWDAATDGMVLSERAASIYNVQDKENLTRSAMRELLVPEDRERSRLALEHSIRTKTDYRIEYRLVSPDCEFRWVSARGRATYDEAGNLTGMLGVVQDITARKNAEAALEESREQLQEYANTLELKVSERTAKLKETIAELESFSYSISHDLRAPLRAMQSFATLLAEDCHEQIGPEGKDYIRRIVTSAERMDRLIQDILRFSRIARADLQREPVNVDELLRSILESYPQFEAARDCIEVSGALPIVLGNEAALTQCISNLLGNAIKFVAPGFKPNIVINAEVNDGAVKLFFKDNGIGIDPEDHERVFGIFQQLDKGFEGTGIGLAIVKKAVERMGGSVGILSKAGQGSTFWIQLASPPES
jgi:PAS domain S-box-containing protein